MMEDRLYLNESGLYEAELDVLDISYSCGGMNTGEIQSLHRVNKMFLKKTPNTQGFNCIVHISNSSHVS